MAVLTARRESASTRRARRYRVLLHNDDVNEMDHVVRSILRSVPGIDINRAFEIMHVAHTQGLAVVIVCPLEPAELYRDALLSCGLLSTIEME